MRALALALVAGLVAERVAAACFASLEREAVVAAFVRDVEAGLADRAAGKVRWSL